MIRSLIRFLFGTFITFILLVGVISGLVYKFRDKPLPFKTEIKLAFTEPVLHDSLAADSLLTDEQLAVLQLEKREKDLNQIGDSLITEDAVVKSRLDSIRQVKESIENLIAQKEQIEEDQVKRLTKVYDSMDPGAAASILERLNDQTIVMIMQGMKAQNVAQILALLEPLRAADLSTRLAQRQ